MFLKKSKKGWKEFKICRIISIRKILNFAVPGFRYLFVSRAAPDTLMGAENPMPGPLVTAGDGDHEILCNLVTDRIFSFLPCLSEEVATELSDCPFKIDLDGCRTTFRDAPLTSSGGSNE